MARTKQRLINYNTSGTSTMPAVADVEFGEIVVRHAAEKPQLMIKVKEGDNELFKTFIDSGAVETAIKAEVLTINGNFESLSGAIETLSGTVVSSYAISSITHNEITAATEAAKTYADNQDDALSGRIITHVTTAITNPLSGRIDTVESDLSTVSAGLETLSGKVVSDYATKEFVGAASGYALSTAVGKAGDAKTANTIYGAKAYADDKVGALSGDVLSYVNTELGTVNGNISALSGAVSATSAAVKTLSGDIVTYVNSKVTSAYIYKGSVANKAALPQDANVGDVYNVVAANGNPGDDGYTPAGTNYAWTGTEWDALGGTVDLSNYATTATTDDLDTRLDTVESNLTTATAATTGTIATVSGKVVELSGKVVSDYATSANTENAINAAKVEAEIASSAYTDSQIQMLSGVTSAYVDTKLTTINSDISDLQAFTANTAATHTEVENASGNAITSAVSIASGYSKEYTDFAISTLKGTATTEYDTLGKIESKISGLSGAVETNESNIGTVSGHVVDIKSSATTYWNKATQGGELGTVANGASHKTEQSGAKMSYTDGGKITLDLSELVIDCGSF